jgi:hypothetical protein
MDSQQLFAIGGTGGVQQHGGKEGYLTNTVSSLLKAGPGHTLDSAMAAPGAALQSLAPQGIGVSQQGGLAASKLAELLEQMGVRKPDIESLLLKWDGPMAGTAIEPVSGTQPVKPEPTPSVDKGPTQYYSPPMA